MPPSRDCPASGEPPSNSDLLFQSTGSLGQEPPSRLPPSCQLVTVGGLPRASGCYLVWASLTAASTGSSGMDSGTNKKSRSYLAWTDEMDKAMLDTFVEYYDKGDRAQNGWKPHVYTAAVKNVSEKCEKQITKDNIIARSKTFDKHYVTVNNMLSQSGFGWDDEKKMISVDSDDVWNNYVKANKDATSYRYKVIKYWDMISALYTRDRATGGGARTAAESASEMVEEIGNNKDNDDGSSSRTAEDRKKKRRRSDDSVASMLGEKLDNFTAAF